MDDKRVMESDEQKVIVQVTCPSCTEMFETEIADHSREQEDALIEAAIKAAHFAFQDGYCTEMDPMVGILRGLESIRALTPASIRQRVKE